MIRTKEIHSLEDTVRLAHDLVRMDTEIDGGWEIFQILTHLAEYLENSISGFPYYHPVFIRRSIGAFFFQRFKKAGYRTTRKPHPPTVALDGDGGEALLRFEEACLVFEQFQGEPAEHPFFGKMDYEEWYSYHLWHTAHHLGIVIPIETAPHSVEVIEDISSLPGTRVKSPPAEKEKSSEAKIEPAKGSVKVSSDKAQAKRTKAVAKKGKSSTKKSATKPATVGPAKKKKTVTKKKTSSPSTTAKKKGTTGRSSKKKSS